MKEKPRKVVEVGCGLARTSLPFVIKDIDMLVLVDISEKVIKNTKRIYEILGFDDKVSFVVADAFNLPFRDKVFDVSHNLGLIEHFPPKLSIEILIEMKRISKKVLVGVPSCSNIFYELYKIFSMWKYKKWYIGSIDENIFRGKFERCYSKDQLIAEIRNAGLKPEWICYVGEGGHAGVIFDWLFQKIGLYKLFIGMKPIKVYVIRKDILGFVTYLYNFHLTKLVKAVCKLFGCRDDIICLAE